MGVARRAEEVVSLEETPMPHRLWRRDRAPGRDEDLLVHADALYNLARYLSQDGSEAEDLVQETYARALRAWKDFEPGTNLKAWLFRILRNELITRYRHGLRHPAPADYDTMETGQDGAGEGVARGADEPEQ